MFESYNQIYYFLDCVYIGVLISFAYQPVYFLKLPIKNIILKHSLDCLFSLVAVVIYFKLSSQMCFPSLRLYMPLGVLLGWVIICKKISQLLNKLQLAIFNKLKKSCKK